LRPHRAPLYLALGLTLMCTAARAQTAPPDTTQADDPDTAELNKALAAAAFGGESARLIAEAKSELAARGANPFQRGFNLSLNTTSQFDSAGGWQSILAPTFAFRFNRHFSLFAGVPVYSYINTFELISAAPTAPVKPSAVPTPPTAPTSAVDMYGYRKHNFVLGDADIAGQYAALFRPFGYALTATIGLPTGDETRGLGAGQVTYSFNNHFERPISRRLTPEVEVGIGNSPNLVDPRIRMSYIDVGTNAHFQAGMSLFLRRGISFTSNAFEELPLSTQTFTSTTTNGKKGKELRTITTTTSKSVGEDNGFLNTLDIPLNQRLTLSAFYNRSLRNRIDTTGFSFTFLLKSSSHSSETR